jgi:hypothetical protein
MSRQFLIGAAVALAAVLAFAVAIEESHRERLRRDAEFLAQCRDAGYDAAKCRFFLTVTGRTNGTADAQIILGATPQ